MNVSLKARWESYVDDIVRTGRFKSASDVVEEGLRLFEERETKLKALQETLAASIAKGGRYTETEVDDHLDRKAAELAKQGY